MGPSSPHPEETFGTTSEKMVHTIDLGLSLRVYLDIEAFPKKYQIPLGLVYHVRKHTFRQEITLEGRNSRDRCADASFCTVKNRLGRILYFLGNGSLP